MLDAIFSFLSEIIAFRLGKFYLTVPTLGRYRPSIDDRNQPLISLFGAVVTIVLVVGLIAWVNHSG